MLYLCPVKSFEGLDYSMQKFGDYDDNQLIVLIAKGNENAMSVLYGRYYELLCRSAFKRLQNETVIEELVQDVFINLWHKAANLDHEGNVKSYLFATLRNKVLYEIRASIAIAKHAVNLIEQDSPHVPDSFELLHTKHLEQKFHEVINELPPQCREAFKLSRLENLSYKTIAERMNISVNTVEKHIGKALAILRKSFREFDTTLSILFVLIEVLHHR